VSTTTILIAGGGSGGHVFPALAVAEAIQAVADVEVVFCGSERGMEKAVVPKRGFRLERLDVDPIRGRGLAGAARGMLTAARTTARSFETLRAVRPHAVLSVGGYAAGPVTLAARLRGIPIAVLEPNCVAGVTNRILGPLAQRAYLACEEVAGAFRRDSIRVYGVPLRPGFSPRVGATGGTSRLLVMGGSQGSAALNERVPSAIGLLAAGGRSVRVMHQAGSGRDGEVREAYARLGVQGVTVAGFVEDIASAIADAELVIARAGAGTIAEIAAIGRASILVPYPHAADDHQARNAEALARQGAAACVRQEDASADRLAREIDRLLYDDASRAKMAAAARARGRPNAARDVAMDLLGLAGGTPRGVPSVHDTGSHVPFAGFTAGRRAG
jgi:UDP-N-acetylglucosamine--N-acetylmuramyl-(pentapeptide) pyrophosphoryl-undecaprenol N-acetylglucosamine transferase